MQARRSRSAFTWLVLSLTLAFSALTSYSERVEDLPKPTNYVSDFAHVLSPQTVARLDRLCGQLDHSATNAQVAVVIVKNLDGDDKADFANRLEEKWKVGKKGSDRGILMLISVEDHHYWTEVGYGLEGILPDAKVGDVGRMMLPHLRQHDYDGAVTVGLTQIANVIATDAKVPLSDSAPGPGAERMPIPQQRHHGSSIGLIFRVVLILLVLLFFGARGLFGFGLGWLFGGGGRGGWGGGGGFGGGGGGGSGGDSGFGGFGGGESGGGGAGGDY
jgi:uncharacterized protein